MDAGLADKETDTPMVKEVKEEMRSLVSEDPDEAFEIFSSTSSKRLSEMEEDDGDDSPNNRIIDDDDDTDNQDTRNTGNKSDDNQSKARKYLGKLKTSLKRVGKWINENKDKSLGDILVKSWKDNCSDEKLKSSMDKCKKKVQKKNSKNNKKSNASKCRELQTYKELDQ